MEWQPNEESLKTLAACLKDSLSGFNKTAQKQAELVSRRPSPPATELSRESFPATEN
jgi:hypothetical protein